MNLLLREILEEDLPTFYEHQADPAVAALAGYQIRAHDAFFEHWRTKVIGDPTTRRASVLVDGKLMGNLLAFDRGGRRLVGYWYGRDAWGRGIASAALKLFLKAETQRPLHAWVTPKNVGSMRVLEKNGFVRGELHVDEAGHEEVLFTLAPLAFTLREVVETDLPVFYENQRHGPSWRLAAVQPREHDAFYLHWRTKILGDPLNHKKTVVVNGEVAGHIVCWPKEGVRWVGYWYGERFWGRGLASAALVQFLAIMSDRPIYATVAAHNHGSLRVLEKCGFRRGPMSRGADGIDEYFFTLD